MTNTLNPGAAATASGAFSVSMCGDTSQLTSGSPRPQVRVRAARSTAVVHLGDVRELLGRSRSADHVDGPCPLCSAGRQIRNRRKPVLRIYLQNGRPHGFYCVHCGARGVVPGSGGVARTGTKLHALIPTAVPQRSTVARVAAARSVWNNASPLASSLAERYLRGRGFEPPWPVSLRYHARLGYSHDGGHVGYFPALVAKVSLWPHDDLVATHRTYLSRDGGKLALPDMPAKKALGPTQGGAVHIRPYADGKSLIVCEGIETALAVSQMEPKCGVWACLSTSGLRSIVVPPAPIIIAADNDNSGAGWSAALALSARLQRQGLLPRIAMPPRAGTDFADLLLEGCDV